MKIEGICVVITGAADGIGRAVTVRLLEKGAKFVAILDVNETKGEETTKDLAKKFGKERVQFFLCNVAEDDEVKSAFQQAFDVHKHLDVIINNAGVAGPNPDMIAINLGSAITGSYLAKDFLSKKTSGSGGILINTASVAGLNPFGDPLYTATKFGVVGLSLALSIKDSCFSQDDVRVGVICPGFVDTNLKKHIRQEIREKVVFVRIDHVVDAFMMIIEDDTKHNCCVRITPKLGIDLHPLTSPQEFAKLTGIFKE